MQFDTKKLKKGQFLLLYTQRLTHLESFRLTSIRRKSSKREKTRNATRYKLGGSKERESGKRVDWLVPMTKSTVPAVRRANQR